MTSKVLSSGKHALTVRVSEEDYKNLRMASAIVNMSVQELMVKASIEKAGEILKPDIK